MTDPYLDPATGLLRNSLGITTAADLEAAERELSHLALLRLEDRPLPGRYDLNHLRAFHHAIFGDLYPWAGELRTVSIAKVELFCLPQNLERFSEEIFSTLAKDRHLRDLPREDFLDRLTFHFGEVNALHPFREGNGRAQRAFFRQLARSAGYLLDWRTLGAEQNLVASVAIMRGDPSPMRVLFATLVSSL